MIRTNNAGTILSQLMCRDKKIDHIPWPPCLWYDMGILHDNGTVENLEHEMEEQAKNFRQCNYLEEEHNTVSKCMTTELKYPWACPGKNAQPSRIVLTFESSRLEDCSDQSRVL